MDRDEEKLRRKRSASFTPRFIDQSRGLTLR
jgi:hypothetical protein